jgi:MYXO-CTERM domain-containing protein
MSMKTLAVALAMAAGAAAQAVVVSPGNSSSGWNGYMNVFELPSNGGGFIFGSGWGVADLNTSFNDGAQTLTMSPNTIGDPNSFWYTPSGGPGSTGNKIMEANLYVQDDSGAYAGQTLTFTGNILSNSFTSAHEAKIFIRDFAPDYSSFNQTIVNAGSGIFSISLALDPGAGRHVQYGFQVKGACVWFTDVAPFGNMVVSTGAIPAPGAAGLLALGGLVAGRRRR